jgi:hypothetical protein
LKLFYLDIVFLYYKGENFDVAGFDYEDEEDGANNKAKTAPAAKTPATTSKPSSAAAKPRSSSDEDSRPKRLLKVRRIRRNKNADPKFLQLVIKDEQ